MADEVETLDRFVDFQYAQEHLLERDANIARLTVGVTSIVRAGRKETADQFCLKTQIPDGDWWEPSALAEGSWTLVQRNGVFSLKKGFRFWVRTYT